MLGSLILLPNKTSWKIKATYTKNVKKLPYYTISSNLCTYVILPFQIEIQSYEHKLPVIGDHYCVLSWDSLSTPLTILCTNTVCDITLLQSTSNRRFTQTQGVYQQDQEALKEKVLGNIKCLHYKFHLKYMMGPCTRKVYIQSVYARTTKIQN
jgi:hypothetical protein